VRAELSSETTLCSKSHPGERFILPDDEDEPSWYPGTYFDDVTKNGSLKADEMDDQTALRDEDESLVKAKAPSKRMCRFDYKAYVKKALDLLKKESYADEAWREREGPPFETQYKCDVTEEGSSPQSGILEECLLGDELAVDKKKVRFQSVKEMCDKDGEVVRGTVMDNEGNSILWMQRWIAERMKVARQVEVATKAAVDGLEELIAATWRLDWGLDDDDASIQN
jgi:hypothetical protein